MVADLVMLNAKNRRIKRPSKNMSPKLYCPLKMLERKGSRANKLEILPRLKIHPVFHVFLLEPYRASHQPNGEQPPRDHEDIEGDLEWEVEMIIQSEICSNTRRVRGRNKHMKEPRYFVKRKGCANDENASEPPECRKNMQEEAERFHRTTRRCQAQESSSNIRKGFHPWTGKPWWFFFFFFFFFFKSCIRC